MVGTVGQAYPSLMELQDIFEATRDSTHFNDFLSSGEQDLEGFEGNKDEEMDAEEAEEDEGDEEDEEGEEDEEDEEDPEDGEEEEDGEDAEEDQVSCRVVACRAKLRR